MGLDTVELVIRMEEAFHIQIPDEAAEKVQTVGDAYSLVLLLMAESQSTMDSTKPAGCLSSNVFYRLRRGLLSVSELPRHAIRPSAPLSFLIPFTRRREVWLQLAGEAQLELPPLVRPAWLCGVMSIATLAVGLGTILAMWEQTNSAAAIVAAVLRMVISGSIFFVLTIPFAVSPQRHFATIGGLTMTAVGLNAVSIANESYALPRSEVWELLQAIIVDVLGVDASQVTPETRFVEDLGAG